MDGNNRLRAQEVYNPDDESALVRYLADHSSSAIELKTVELLMAHENCGINFQDPFLRQTPLMQAIRKNRADIFEAILNHSDIDVTVAARYERTALQMAVLKGRAEFVTALLGRNATISERFKKKWYNAPFHTMKILLERKMFKSISKTDLLDIVLHYGRWRWHKHFESVEEAKRVALECVLSVESDPKKIDFGRPSEVKTLVHKVCASGLIEILEFLLQNNKIRKIIRNESDEAPFALEACFRFSRIVFKKDDISMVQDCLACAKRLLKNGNKFQKAMVKFGESAMKKHFDHSNRFECITAFYKDTELEKTKESQRFFLFLAIWMNHVKLLRDVLSKSKQSSDLKVDLNKSIERTGTPFELALKTFATYVHEKQRCKRTDTRILKILKKHGAKKPLALPFLQKMTGTSLQIAVAKCLKTIVDMTIDPKGFSAYPLQVGNRIENDSFAKLKLDIQSMFNMKRRFKLSLCLGCKSGSHRIQSCVLQSNRLVRFEMKCSLCYRACELDEAVKMCSNNCETNLFPTSQIVCSHCAFFKATEDGSRSINAFEIADRVKNASILNPFIYIRTKVGKEVRRSGAINSALLLQNAKIDSPEILQRFLEFPVACQHTGIKEIDYDMLCL